MTIAQLEIVLRALAAVRKANQTVRKAQEENVTLLNGEPLAKELSTVRVELSVAAGHLAKLVDQELTAEPAKGGAS